MQFVERLPAERVNTYHDQSPTSRGRVGGRRQRRVDVVELVLSCVYQKCRKCSSVSTSVLHNLQIRSSTFIFLCRPN